jgi:hypothetical protein
MLGDLNFYVTRVSVFLITAALIAGMAGCTGDDGSYAGPRGHPPSQNSPPQNLEIRTWYDLDAVRNNLAGNHTLMNDLDLTSPGYEELASLRANDGRGWQPIGFVERIFWDSPFGGGGSRTDWYGINGTFDGQGYEIRDLLINRPSENDVGLFGVVNEGGVIKDIGAVYVIVIGDYYVGGLVGRNQGTVSNSYCSGSVDGYHSVGGLVGWSYLGAVSNSYSTGRVTGDRYVGGLVGINNGGTVSNSYSTGNVTGNEDVGGLVGINDQGTLSNSYSTGNVNGNEYVGGLVGTNERGTVSNSFWDVQTSGQTRSDGGTGKTTAQMKEVATFSGAGWNIVAVANAGTHNPSYIWNTVDGETYPFLSWQS